MKSKKRASQINHSRRELLQNSTLGVFGLSHFGLIAEAIFQGAFNKAYAADGLSTNKNYIYISQNGAPARWYYDLPLTPDGKKDKFQSSKMVGTRYIGDSRYVDISYDTTLVNGIHMPWMWQFDIAEAGGGMVPMSNLMEGMLIIRGTNTNNPAHAAAQTLHYRPQGIPVSLTALTSDQSDKPIAAINMNASRYIFKSAQGHSATSLNYSSNMIKTLMNPFIEKNPSNFKSDQQIVENAFQLSLNSLNQLAKEHHPKSELIKNNMESAVSLFSKNFGDLDEVYKSLYSKYIDLISRTINPERVLVGINDKPIGLIETENLKRDIRYRYGNDQQIVANEDMRTIISMNAHNNTLAQRFAVTEFVMINKLSSSISFNADSLRNLNTENGQTSQSYDEHTVGCMPSLLTNTYGNLAFSACLYELKQQLKANNLYNDTVIDIAGEFGRLPRNDGGGSDHSAQANCSILHSGAIEGNGHVIGNIRANAGNRDGTWGYGGDNPGFGYLNLGHFVSTLSHIMGIESPVTAVPSLLRLENNKLIPKLPTGTIVD